MFSWNSSPHVGGLSRLVGIDQSFFIWLFSRKEKKRNAYVEGAVATCLSLYLLRIQTLHPSTVKRKLGLASGSYTENKKQAFAYASARSSQIDSHHLADCYIMAEYYYTILQAQQELEECEEMYEASESQKAMLIE